MTQNEFLEDVKVSLKERCNTVYNEGYSKALSNTKFDPIGMKNLCFSLASSLDCDDKRQLKFYQQRTTRGFDDTELWNLDTTILKFIIPRLKEFKKKTVGYPTVFKSLDEWKQCIQKMIDSMESIIEDVDANYDGWELFKEYFFSLWD